jgi:hypothetical protein
VQRIICNKLAGRQLTGGNLHRSLLRCAETTLVPFRLRPNSAAADRLACGVQQDLAPISAALFSELVGFYSGGILGAGRKMGVSGPAPQWSGRDCVLTIATAVQVDGLSPYHRYGRVVLAKPSTQIASSGPWLRIPSPRVGRRFASRAAFARGGPRLTFRVPRRRSTSPEPAGRFGRMAKCARILRPAPSELGAATQPHFIRGPRGRPMRLKVCLRLLPDARCRGERSP